jgi:hypothetical protein
VLGGRILVAEDTAAYFFANRANLHAIAHGAGFSWWDPLPGLGQPRLGNIQSGSFAPLSLLFYALPTATALRFHPWVALLLLSGFTFALFRAAGLARTPSLFGAFSWSTLGSLLTHVQHLSAIETVLWLPATLLAWELYLRAAPGWRKAGFAWLAGLGVAFQCFGGLPQFVVYDALVMALWIALSLLRGRSGERRRHAAVAAGIATIGLGVASWQLLPFIELAQHSHRTWLADAAAFRDGYRAAPREIALALAAELFAFVEAPVLAHGAPYRNVPNFSLLTIAFAALALLRRPRAVAEWGFAAFFLAGMLGSAAGVTTLIAFVFPPAGLLRAPFRMIVPAAFWISWLAAWGMHHWLAPGSRRRAAFAALAIAWLVLLGFVLRRPGERYVEASFFRIPEVFREATPRVAMDVAGSERVPLFSVNAGLAAGVETLFPREVLVPRGLFEAWFASQYGSLEQHDRVDRMITSLVLPLRDVSPSILRAFRLATLVRYTGERYEARDLEGTIGRFQLASEAIAAPSDAERWSLAASSRWDPRRQVIVREPLAFERSGALREEVRVLHEQADRQLVEVESAGGVLVGSGLFFPGWRAEVDGEPARALEVDLALRGVVVPPGRHRIAWSYRPTWLAAAFGGTALALIAALAVLAASRGSAR